MQTIFGHFGHINSPALTLDVYKRVTNFRRAKSEISCRKSQILARNRVQVSIPNQKLWEVSAGG